MLPDDIIVVDGFYADPKRMRDLALGADYNVFGESQNFPGAESKKAFFSSLHIKRFEELLGHPIYVDPTKYVFGKFRYAMANDTARTQVHFDKVDWTAIVYLSLDENCRGGLGLYRHRATGLVTIPHSPEDLAVYGCHNAVEFDQRYVLASSTDPDAWELLHEIEISFNRLLLFPGSRYFHGITRQFGDTPTDSRLTQNFFFQKARSGSDLGQNGSTTA